MSGAAGPEALLRHADFVRGLARSLLYDPADADDVAQQAWLATLQHPPGRAGNLSGWLGTVVRHAAHDLWRARRRRARLEAAAARPEAVVSAADVAATEEVRQRVVAAVLALEEPYRSTVLLRYYQDRPPREIAAAQGVPVETVRTRLKRGLARLREALDARHGTRAAWALLLLPLAGGASTAHAATREPTVAAGASAGSAVGLWVGAGGVGVVLLAGGATLWAVRGAGEPSLDAATPVVTASDASASPVRSVVMESLDAEPPPRAPAPPRPPAGPAPVASTERRRRWLEDFDAIRDDVAAHCRLLSLKGVDWPATCARLRPRAEAASGDVEYLQVIDELVACLRDSQASLDARGAALPAPRQEAFPGVVLAAATDRRVVVLEVQADASGDARLLRPGLVVTEIDGHPARDWLEARATTAWEGGGYSSVQRARHKAFRLGLAGPPDTYVRVVAAPVAAADAPSAFALLRDRPLAFARLPSPPDGVRRDGPATFGLLPDGVGYLHLARMDDGGNRFDEGFRTAMQHLQHASALVVDLRGNGGGGVGRQFIATFSDDGGEGALPRPWTRPLAVLIDAGTFGAGEGAASMFRVRTAARLFGGTTAGSSSQKRTFTAPSGLFAVTYAWRGRTNFGSTITEFAGIEPHEPVELEPEALLDGRDPVLERARAWLRGR